VALSSGPKFGPDSAGWARINVATSEQILDEVIDRIAVAVDQSSIA
jgi:bifunctional pyridoxal-dependent enzyme with beta-cystathionase and maltose regulon repressor activities